MQGIGAVNALNFGAPDASPRLVKAAHEFEAQMMKELLKPMTGSAWLDEDDDADRSGGALQEFASEALGRGLSERGGLGIASSIVKSLSRRSDSSRGATETQGPTSLGIRQPE